MNHVMVSVVVPVYNGERFLAAALESILAQDYRHFEIIVVDDGSTDGSSEIARSPGQVRYIHQKNQGVAWAWNRGIEASHGELIAFLAQDDLWTPNKLSVQVPFLLAHPELQYVIARARYFLEPGHSLPRGFRKELLGKDHVARIVETMLARRSLFDDIGGFNTSLSSAQDVDWFARAKDAHTPMAVMSEVLLLRRIHGDNLTYRSLEEGNQNLLRVVRRSIERRETEGERRRGERR